LVRYISVIIFVVFGISSANALTENKPGRISGLIIDNDTKGVISGASIILEYKKTGDKLKSESNLSGGYVFELVPPGEYRFQVSRLGYEKYSIDFLVEPSEEKVLDIYLNPSEIETEKINVTATKTEQTLQKTPSSISLILSEDIKNRNKFTFDQVLEDVQGVTINRTSGINVSALSIRGSSDVAGGGIGNRVLLLLDGRPSLTGDSKGALWSLIPVSIIERTEVVKGAFSSLYGSSAIGGVVNVITKKPTYKPYTSISLSGGFYEKLSDSLKFSDRLQTFKSVNLMNSNTISKFSYLVNLDYKQNDGYAEQNDYKFYSGLGKFTYDLFGNRDLELTLQYTNSESGYPHYWRQDAGRIAEPYKVSPFYIGDKIYKETESIDVFYKAVPNSSTKYSSRFYYYKLYSRSEYNPKNPVALAYGTPGLSFENTITSYNFGNISQMDYAASDRHYFIAGLDLQWNVVRSSPASILYGDQQQYNTGIYLQDQWNLILNKDRMPVLSTTLGARFDYNKFIGSFEEKQVSPKISLLFSPDIKSGVFENTSYRVLIGKAFRSPSIAELYFKKELFGGFDFIYNPNLKPESMLSFEVGFRKQYKSRFTFDAAAYINLYDNLIQYVNIGGAVNGPFQVQNVTKAQISGIELMTDYTSSFRLFDNQFKYTVSADYTYIDARDLSSNRKDDFLPYKPKHVFNTGVNLSYLGFNYNINGRYVSEVEEVIFYKYEEPKSYFLLNMKLSKSITDRITLYVAVNNITNKFYQELERIPAPNRNYTAGINAEF